ncbi:hypothetical protein ONZ45_g8424 [Pleurotus djamor]|nr:hypothetical protein ONZ45_g8424 [Pleurotus djamor]
MNMLSFVITGISVTFLLYRLFNDGAPPGIPRLSRAGGIGYLITATHYAFYGRRVLDEGARRFGSKPFALPTLAGWIIILDKQHIETVRTGDDRELFQMDYTIGSKAFEFPFHISSIREITRNASGIIPALDDATMVFAKAFDSQANSGNTSVSVHSMVVNVMGSVIQRVLLGEELSRNKHFGTSMVRFTTSFFSYGKVLCSSPKIFRRVLYFILSAIWGGTKEPMTYIVPHVAKRIEENSKPSSSEHQPNRVDLIGSLIKHATPTLSTFDIARKVLLTEIGSIHTSSTIVTQALFELSQMFPEDVSSIREEIEQVLSEEHCWNKAGLSRLTKLDSLLREIGRFHGISLLAMQRLTAIDTQLHDGTILPAGYYVAFDLHHSHFDPQVYPSPEIFDPFRFSNLNEHVVDDVLSATKYNFSRVDSTYLLFNTGRHACPGRFFASMQIKIMLAHILLNYDVKLPDGQTIRPSNLVFDGMILPPMKAHLIFQPRARLGKDTVG